MESQSESKNNVNPPSYEEVAQSTVTVIPGNSLGSGFFIDKNLLVTNYHVVEDAKDGVVFSKTQSGIEDAGKVVVADTENDLAIIRTLRGRYTALEMGNSEELEMGDEIFVIGSPKDLSRTLSKGFISAKREDGSLLQIDASISSGSSGSPVFSKDFKVIGIAVGSWPGGQNLNFAIPVSKLRNLIQKNKVALERVETEEAVKQSDSSFNKELASYEKKENKTPQEMFDMASAYYLEEDYQKAFFWIEKVANQGYASAQHNLAVMYNKGEGVTKDYKKAVYWYQKSADQGYAPAQFNLALIYDKGEGVTKDYEEAGYWYQKAADQGHADAQYNLAVKYDNGEGVAKNHQKALHWYEKAANQGYVDAQFNLGTKYDKGEGVAADHKKALYWYKKAANQGQVMAQLNLGVIYDNGEMIKKNYSKAVYWYEKAANQGDAKAQFNLGLKYGRGEGVAKNYIEAYKWVILAKAQSNEDDEKINEVLDLLEESMTPSQIAEAQELASQFEVQGK